MEAPSHLPLLSAGMRIVVERTFVSVVEEDSSSILEMAVKRAFSAPVVSSRRGEPPAGTRGEQAKSFDIPLELAQDPITPSASSPSTDTAGASLARGTQS
ncbi:unnamed protein product [Prorocentrum cordatum]|uniref:Uncharacterized protein n=1 Tax=Prorocentrum cordatum TaxID=2364126 RepID=A0ABN9WWA4_9DINO|nr:unnamed protein product [Polarella glacialis]